MIKKPQAHRLSVLLGTVFLHAMTLGAAADIAPTEVTAWLGNSPVPTAKATIVRMAEETVVIDLLPEQHRFAVQADFRFHNKGWKDETLSCRFPLIDSCGCLDPGETVTVSQASTPWGRRTIPWKMVTDRQWLTTQWSGLDSNEVRTEYIMQKIDWAQFHLTFPREQDTCVRVAYRQTMKGFRADYILHTGAGWAGTIGKATIIVRAPSEAVARRLYADLPWGRGVVRGRTITWQRENFEPTSADDFRLLSH